MADEQEYSSIASIPHAIRRAAQRYGDATALVDDGRRRSFRDLEQEMVRAVRAARGLGVRRGDRVGLCAPNSAEWITAALGIQGAGGIVVPLNTRFKAAELAHILRASGATALFASRFLGTDYVAELLKEDPDLPALRTTVSVRGPRGAADLDWRDFLARAVEGPDETEAYAALDDLAADDVSDVIFTSGTTGRPKGVALTHGQSLRPYGWMARAYGFRPGDTCLVVPPFFHCFGYKAGWLASFLTGVTVVPVRLFDAGQALELIERERVSVITGPPTVFQDLLRHPDRPRRDLSSLRVSMTGGTTVPEALVHAMRDELGFEVVLSAYGLTEASALVTTTRIGDGVPTVARTAGRPIPGVEVRITDNGGRGLPPGEPGEVRVRGYTVTRGYWEDSEATAAAIGPDGWLRTGDVGCLDADGNLAVVDRKKDMYIVGGFNAYPAEIEELLLGCAGIQRAAVVGVPDERLGEVGCAFVIRAPDSALTEADVIAWAREHMANFKVPRHVRFVADFPRTASGKVTKDALRARFAGP